MTEKERPDKNRDDNFQDDEIFRIRLSLEKQLDEIRKLIESRHFDNEEQVRRFIDQVVNAGAPPTGEPQTPLEKAQHLIFEAWEARTRKECIALARQALKISPDCADAYVILAEEYATSLGEALCYYRAGLAAGERAIGKEKFQTSAGHFWQEINTRPYMRARAGLAECLWEMGKQPEAIDHYQGMLKLNPADDQGIRYILAACLLKMGDLPHLKELLNRFKEVSCAWLYSRALVLFAENGDSPEARSVLVTARQSNRYVIPYLIGRKQLPRQLPSFVGFGDRNEDIYYAMEFGPGWLETPGAVEWLKLRSEEKLKKSESGTAVRGIPEVFLRAFDNPGEPVVEEKKTETIYTFKVGLKCAPGVWRKIDIRGSQSLHNLHKAIFSAFRRYDDHLYAFFLSNRIWDEAAEYGVPTSDRSRQDARKARINSLGLTPKARFLYIFDFGDLWEHPITLLNIREEEPHGHYPRVIESRGKAPPQYPEKD